MRFIFIFPTLVISSLSIHAQENPAEVTELRETISKIVDIQTLESKEKIDWETRKNEIANLLELHQRELTLLTEELEKAGSSAPSHQKQTSKLKTQIDQLKATRQLTSETVARNIPRTLSISKRLPKPLLSEVETDIAALQAWKPADEPRDALRAILAILTKSEQFNRRFTRTTEIIDNREVQILYLGLAQAFYTDRKDNSGTGHPSTDGWEWKPNPEILKPLSNALDTIDKKRPPSMVTLPLQIK